MNDAVIDMQGLTKVFLTDEVETHALEGIDLQIQRGEFVSISGPSGCGKSTLLSIVGLLCTKPAPQLETCPAIGFGSWGTRTTPN